MTVKADMIIAGILDDAGDLVSGLALEEIGEDGHALANRLWKVAGHLRRRAGGRPSPREAFFAGDDGEGDEDVRRGVGRVLGECP